MGGLAVIAVGGNAIVQEGQNGSIQGQSTNILRICDQIINLVEAGYNIILTFGSGPQIGYSLLKVEASAHIVPPNPLDVCNAEIQGGLGYIFQQSLSNVMSKRGINKKVATVITQVAVDKNDFAFQIPIKPIGPFYSRDQAEEIKRDKGAIIVEDSGRGYRRVVPSPKPLEVIEKDVIKCLADNGFIVIAAGSGGVPVVREHEELKGVEAVVDKDHVSALVAQEVKADFLIMLTAVEQVSINYNTANQRALAQITLTEARRYLKDGQFPPGSMGPKIEAAVYFIEHGGLKAIITSTEKLKEALEGKAGTSIIAN